MHLHSSPKPFLRDSMGLVDENEDGDVIRKTWAWTWTFAVILLIFFCRLLTSLYFYYFAGPSNKRRDGAQSSSPVDSCFLRTTEIISDLDLKNLIHNLDDENDNLIWENVVDKSTDFISYSAKCCKPMDGPIKYMSVTTFEDCSIEALVNFYMDNQYRIQWDKTVIHHQQLQLDQGSGTEFGRTIKKFPFLTPREYVLAWRLWQGVDGSFYCFSKECEHPLAPKEKRYIRVAVFRSGWRIRKVPGRNACEIKMVHQEDAGLNVEMAKLAFAKGIWSYVCKMDYALRKYSVGRNQLESGSGATMSIQKVPSEFETTNSMIGTVRPENSITANDHRGTHNSNMKKLTRKPSSRLITNGLVLLGGAICLSRGHSSLGAKVAVAYMLSKLTKRGVPSDQAMKLSCNKSS